METRVYLPQDVAEWLDERASDVYKSRATYIRDLLIELYRKRNGGVTRAVSQ